MDAQALRSLSRVELQKLAKNNLIKANAKSITIIENLLTIFPAGVPYRATTPILKRPRRSSIEQREGVLPVIQPDTPAARTRSKHKKSRFVPPAQVHACPAEAHASPSQPQAIPAQAVASPTQAVASPTQAVASPTRALASPAQVLAPPVPAHISPIPVHVSPIPVHVSPIPAHVSPIPAQPSLKRPLANAPPPPATLPRASTSRKRQRMDDETIFPLRHSDFTPFAYTTPRPGRGFPDEPQSDSHSPVYTPQEPLPSAFHATDELQFDLPSPFTTPRALPHSGSTEPLIPREASFSKPFSVDKEEATNYADSIFALLEQIGDQAAHLPDLRARHALLKESVREQRRQLGGEKALRIKLDALLASVPLVGPESDAHDATDDGDIKENPVGREVPMEEESTPDASLDRHQHDETNENPVDRDVHNEDESTPGAPLDQTEKEETEDEWFERIRRQPMSPLSSVKRQRGEPIPEPPPNPFMRAPQDPRPFFTDSVIDSRNDAPLPPCTPPRAVQTPEEVAELILEVREEISEEHAVARALGAGPSASEVTSPRYMEEFDGEVRRRTLHRLSQGAALSSSPHRGASLTPENVAAVFGDGALSPTRRA